MNKKNLPALCACIVFLAGCGKNVKGTRAPGLFHADQYERLAEKISDGHKYISNKKVAVLPFSYTDKRPSNDGTVVSERLLTRIINRRELEVIERGLLEKVLSELKLQSSGAIDESSIKGIGKVLGVQAVVTGTLTRHKDGRLEINARMINAESGAVLAAAAETVMPDWETAAVPQVTAFIRPAPAPVSPVRRVPAVPVDLARCPSGMVSYWNFDAVNGAEAGDVFGRNSGWLNGPVPTAEGKVSSALDFRGSDYLRVRGWQGPKIAKKATIEAWVKFRTINYADSGARIFCRGGGYCFVIGGPGNWDSRLAFYMDGLPGWQHGSARLSPNTWYHTAFTYDGSKVTLYLNGEADGSFPAAGRIQDDPAKSSFIGWDPEAAGGYHSPLDGAIDEIAVYNRALTSKEILQHYRKGLKGKGYCAG